jgi:hypothetical protein
MTTSRSRAALGVVLGVALAATAAWLALLLAHGDQPRQAAQPPPTPAATTSPTETTTAPAFTRDGAVAGLRIIVRKRLEAFNTLDATLLETLYTADCRLADGSSCLKGDLGFLGELKQRNQHLDGYPNQIQEITVTSWEPVVRTAVMRLVYQALPGKLINSNGTVTYLQREARRMVDEVNLSWDGVRWRQALVRGIEPA